MPVVVIVPKDKAAVPAIIAEDDEAALLAKVNDLDCPTFESVEHLRAWLETLPAPSGLFKDVGTAQAQVKARNSQAKRD